MLIRSESALGSSKSANVTRRFPNLYTNGLLVTREAKRYHNKVSKRSEDETKLRMLSRCGQAPVVKF